MPHDIAQRLKLAVAQELAAAGGYERAESLIAGPNPTPQELDLLARIHVQREDFASAKSCWEQAAAADPGQATSYRPALSALAEHVQRLHFQEQIKTFLYLLTLVIGVVAIAILVLARNLG